jgi:hypothetical protein
MAGRIRSLKPEILEDAKTANLDDLAWRLFVSLILLCDDHGNARGDVACVQGAALWASRKSREDVASGLASLSMVDLVSFYDVRGQLFVHIVNWTKHQKVDHPSKPRMALPTDDDAKGISWQQFLSRESPEILARMSRDTRESLAPDHRSPITDHERDPRARAHDPTVPVQSTDRGPTALARGTVIRPPITEDPDVLARRRLGDRTWDRLNELRKIIGAELGEVLHSLDDQEGKGDLQARIREAGPAAEENCDRVLAVLAADARRDRDSSWLRGSAFSARSWARSLAKPDPRAQAKRPMHAPNGRERDEDGNEEFRPGDSPYSELDPALVARMKRQAAEENAEILARIAKTNAKRGTA